MTDRQLALINKIDEYINDEEDDLYLDFDDYRELNDLFKMLPKMNWVSVEDELPKEAGEYLVTYHPCHWDRVYDEIEVGLDTFRGKTTWAKNKYQKVIAWMPKPKAYEP